MERELFQKQVFALVRAIPPGKVMVYGQIALLVGYPRHARLVGRILSRASGSLGLPCHRVVNSQGRTAPGWREQAELLRAEGVGFRANGCVDLKQYVWRNDEIPNALRCKTE